MMEWSTLTDEEIARAHPALRPHLRRLQEWQAWVEWYARRAEEIAAQFRARARLSTGSGESQ